MNREQARKIADEVFYQCSKGDGLLRYMIADALHAAYEPELEALRAEVSKLKMELSLPAPTPDVGWRVSDSARLASIKETARRILAAEATTGEDSIRRRNGFNEGMDLICESTIDWAESFESAFERRYGGKP